jgi:hypothetical protein
MPPAHPAILEPVERLIGLFLLAPATATAARIVLCLPFWWSGMSKLLDFSGGTAEMAALGLEPAWLFNALTILVQLGGSVQGELKADAAGQVRARPQASAMRFNNGPADR